MVYPTTVYHCDTCHKDYNDPADARMCEMSHIVEKTVSNFKQNLEKIFDSSSKIKAKLKPFRRKLK